MNRQNPRTSAGFPVSSAACLKKGRNQALWGRLGSQLANWSGAGSFLVMSLTLVMGESVSAVPPTSSLTFQLTAEDLFIQGINRIEYYVQPEGIEKFTQAIQLNPNFAEAYFYRGRAYSELNPKNLAAAIADYTHAITLNPNYAEAYYYRGIAYGQIEKTQEVLTDYSRVIQAITDYSRVIQLNPDHADAYYQRGLLYEQLGNQRQAIADFKRVIKLKPHKLTSEQQTGITELTRIAQPKSQNLAAYYREVASLYLTGGLATENFLSALQLQSSDRAKAYYWLSFLEHNRYGSAEKILRLYDLAIQLDPKFAEAYFRRARLRSNSQQRIEDYTKAIQLNPRLANAYFERAKLLNQLNSKASIASALQDFTQAIRRDPTIAQAYYQRGLIYSRAGFEQATLSDLIQAVKRESSLNNFVLTYVRTQAKLPHQSTADYYSNILSRRPRTADDYYERGLVRFALQDDSGARSDYAKALELNPNFVEAQIELIRSQARSARADYDSIIQRYPNFAEAYYLQASAQLTSRRASRGGWSTSQLQTALDFFSRAIQLDPTCADAYYLRRYFKPWLERQSGRTDRSNRIQGIEDYLQAIRIDPTFAEAYYDRSQTHCSLRAKRKVVNVFTQTVQANAHDANAYYGRGFAFINLGEFQKALIDFNQAIQLNPGDANFYYGRGFAHYRLKQYPQAIQDFSRSIQLNPNLADTYAMRAFAFYDAGNKQEAFRDASQAIRLDRENIAAYLIRGQIFEDIGNQASAQEDYRRGVGLLPCLTGCGDAGILISFGNPDALYERALAMAKRGDKKGAIANLQRAADLYQAQRKPKRHQEAAALLIQLQR